MSGKEQWRELDRGGKEARLAVELIVGIACLLHRQLQLGLKGKRKLKTNKKTINNEITLKSNSFNIVQKEKSDPKEGGTSSSVSKSSFRNFASGCATAELICRIYNIEINVYFII